MRLVVLSVFFLYVGCGSIADMGTAADAAQGDGDAGNVVVPVCDGTSPVTVTTFKGGGETESLTFGGTPVVRTLSLPTKAAVSAASIQLTGDSNGMAGNNKGTVALTLPNRASQIFALPAEHGTAFWYGRFDDANLLKMNWDGTSEGTMMDLQSVLPRVFGCEADATHIYCITGADGTVLDTSVEQFNHDGTLVKTFIQSYNSLADQIRVPNTDTVGPGSFGVYGIAVGDDFVYLAGNNESAVGFIEKHSKSTGLFDSVATVSSAGGFSGMAYSKAIGDITINGGATINCSTGCIYTSFWGGSMDAPDRITIFDTSLNQLGVIDFGDGLVRDAGLMVSNIGPDGSKVAGAFWLGHFMDPAITTYAQVAEFPADTSLEIGAIDGTPEWSFTGALNQGVGSGDLSAGINAALNSGACDCTGCAVVADNCEIPFHFDSASGGSYTYSQVSITFACTE